MKGVFNMNGFSFLINASVFGNILFWLVALIVFILVLGVIILIHEGGHFFFAKKAGQIQGLKGKISSVLSLTICTSSLEHPSILQGN